MPAMFKANERCYNRTFGLYGLETLNHRSELKILWDTFRSQIAELWFPYDRRSQNFGFHMIAGSQTIADDRKRSQMIAGSQAIAEVCFHMIADDRRTFCDLRSAIRDCLRSYGNQPSMTSRFPPFSFPAFFTKPSRISKT